MAKDWAEWFYQSSAWKNTRAAYIVHVGGYCERCRREVEQRKRSLADMKPIKIVHHKIYLTPGNINDPAVSLSFSNLEGVCEEHHNREHKARKGKRYRFDERGQPVPLETYKQRGADRPPGMREK